MGGDIRFVLYFTCLAGMLGIAGAVSAQTASPGTAAQTEAEARTLVLRHHWTREQLKVVYRIGNTYQPEAMAEINHFMRDRRCNQSIGIAPKLIDLIYELHQELGGNGAVRIVSAYRSEGYNASLLRAGRMVDPHSQHMLGHAADIFIPGVPLDRLHEAAVRLARGGTGRYAYSWPAFVHVDTGPVRQWVEPNPREDGTAAAASTATRRARLRIDCSLKMADVLASIPENRAIAALPPGASVKPPESVQNAALSAGHALPLVHGMNPDGAPASRLGETAANACSAVAPPVPLALLPRPQKTASVNRPTPRAKKTAIQRKRVARRRR